MTKRVYPGNYPLKIYITGRLKGCSKLRFKITMLRIKMNCLSIGYPYISIALKAIDRGLYYVIEPIGESSKRRSNYSQYYSQSERRVSVITEQENDSWFKAYSKNKN
jgi:hypothetical protein